MPWLKMDDSFITNRKLLSVGAEAKLLYIWSLGFAAKELTDGLISRAFLPALAVLAGVKDTGTAVEELLGIGLWEECGESYSIHDYLEYNPTREEVLAVRQARAQAGSIGGQRSASKRQANALANASASAQANLKQNGKQSSTPDPVPVPVPDPLSGPEGIPEESSPSVPIRVPSAPTPKKPKKALDFGDDSEPVHCARKLREAIARSMPDAKLPPDTTAGLQRWSKDFDLAIRVDHRQPEQVLAVIERLPSSWWGRRIFTSEGFRRHYDKIRADVLSPPCQPRANGHATFRPKRLVAAGEEAGLEALRAEYGG